MELLPKRTLDYIPAREISAGDMERMQMWAKTGPKEAEHWHNWECNKERMIPYIVYEAWVKFEDDFKQFLESRTT